jgi:hypothetical protein
VLIALGRPVFELIGLLRILYVVGQLVCAGQVHAAALIDSECLPTACDLGLSFSNHEKARVGICVDTNCVYAVSQQRNCGIRSVYLKHLVLSKVPDAEIHLSFRKFDLNSLVV